MYYIGLDLGGTKLKVVALDAEHRVVYEHTTLIKLLPKAIYRDISILYNHAVQAINFAEHTIGIGIPGSVQRPSYLLDGTDINKELLEVFNHSFSIDNDANCFTLAEAKLGAGKGAKSVFGVILGTGVGGGVVLDDKLYLGNSGLAGEWGHTTLVNNGKMCWCGQQGCAEQYLGGKALEKIFRNNAGYELPAQQIFASNDLVSLCLKEDFYNNLAQGLANIINFYDPEVIVIGGGLSNVDEIYDIVPAKVENLIFNFKLNTRIVKNQLGSDAGAIGAALL